MTVAFSGLVPSMGPAHSPPDLHTLTSSFFSKGWVGTCFLPGAMPGKEMIPPSGARVGGRQTTVARQVGAGTGIHSQETRGSMEGTPPCGLRKQDRLPGGGSS